MAETTQTGRRSGHAFKDTLTSLIIAFVFAFVFRGFVIEAFVIPTGSMAPTLLGKHMRFTSPESGAVWTVDPWLKDAAGNPAPVQGRTNTIAVTDPMTGARVGQELPASLGQNVPTLSGDRIFVLKYLYSVYDPSRFDVVVFKYPGMPGSPVRLGEQENYIKRLVGLPGEEIALVDGDVFVRRAQGAAGSLTRSDWTADNWTIARKPERVQRELWHPVYDSSYRPLNPERNLRRWFRAPWQGLTPDGEPDTSWAIEDRTSYLYSGEGPTRLAWDHDARPITDRYAYNESPNGHSSRNEYAVADVRLAMGVEPERAGLTLAAGLETRGHEFRAELTGDRAAIRMRPLAGGEPGAWRTLEEVTIRPTLAPGEVTNIEFWHVDQSLQLWVEGRRVAMAEYAWTPALRVEHTVGDAGALEASGSGNPLTETDLYPQPRLWWELAGSPVELHRVRLDRDVYYRPGAYPRGTTRAGQASLGAHPSQPNVLGPDQFFVCGDNSPNSLDGRLWDTPDPWVRDRIDPTIGVVPRELLIGKAFFVYFPGMHKERRLPMPDVGRMRFIF
jgi:signal peptidase I